MPLLVLVSAIDPVVCGPERPEKLLDIFLGPVDGIPDALWGRRFFAECVGNSHHALGFDLLDRSQRLIFDAATVEVLMFPDAEHVVRDILGLTGIKSGVPFTPLSCFVFRTQSLNTKLIYQRNKNDIFYTIVTHYYSYTPSMFGSCASLWSSPLLNECPPL